MDKIKKFFEKKKADAKFKLAGEGHKLNQPSQREPIGPTTYESKQRVEGSGSVAQQNAAAAALARLEKKKEPTPQQRSSALIRAQVLKELEKEKQIAGQHKPAISDKDKNVVTKYSVDGIYYKCSLIGPEVLPKKDIENLIKDFLYQQLSGEEAGLTACLVIHTVNKSKEKVQQCIDTLFRYLDNIIQNPQEEKYKKIRINNKVYQEKVAPIEGTQQFLSAAGFQLESHPAANGELEEFWVYFATRQDHVEHLASLRDGLVSAEAIRPELDRSIRVLMPSQAAQKIELPPDFFWLTPEELKREQQLRTEQVEKNLMLRTKAMRERDEQASQRKYRFTLIRIKFPDGLVLQGTFKVNETLQDVRVFVADALQDPLIEFNLISPTGLLGQNDSNLETETLLQLQLCPSAILHFAPTTQSDVGFLRDELMVMIEHA